MFSILYSYYKPVWWKFGQLKSIMKKNHTTLSHEQTYFFLCRDTKEVYLRFLDLYLQKNELWVHVIRPMLRHDPLQRTSSIDTYYNMLTYHRQTLRCNRSIPPLITMTSRVLNPIKEPGTKEELVATQLIRDVLGRQGKFVCTYPKETVEVLKLYLG
jgi:hypothetical protein